MKYLILVGHYRFKLSSVPSEDHDLHMIVYYLIVKSGIILSSIRNLLKDSL